MIWFPIVRPAFEFGKSSTSKIIFRANCLVRVFSSSFVMTVRLRIYDCGMQTLLYLIVNPKSPIRNPKFFIKNSDSTLIYPIFPMRGSTTGLAIYEIKLTGAPEIRKIIKVLKVLVVFQQTIGTNVPLRCVVIKNNLDLE